VFVFICVKAVDTNKDTLKKKLCKKKIICLNKFLNFPILFPFVDPPNHLINQTTILKESEF